MSPSARKVWIEIVTLVKVVYPLPSPSARKVWIEINVYEIDLENRSRSPSARKVWIEI